MPSESTAQNIIRTITQPTDSQCLMRFGHQRPRDTLAGSAGVEASAALGAASAGAPLLTALAPDPFVLQNEGKRCPVSPERALPVPLAGAAGVVASLGGVVPLALDVVLFCWHVARFHHRTHDAKWCHLLLAE